MILKSSGCCLKEESSPAIIGYGFTTEELALRGAKQARSALLFCMVESRIGVDCGDGTMRSVITNAGIELLQQELGIQIRNDIHGIDVYQHSQELKFARMDAEMIVGKSATQFAQLFAQKFTSKISVSEKIIVATELYGSSWFDITPRSRFITLVTAIEALLEPASRPRNVISLLEKFAQKVDEYDETELNKDAKDILKNGLGFLKTQSISQAGRELAYKLLGNKQFNGKDASKFFSYCYNIRSKILHEGSQPSGVNVEQLVTHLEEFVSSMLLAAINNIESIEPNSSDF